MPNIKPISDLRNYTEVLRDVEEGAPVFLTKNGRGRYAIVDMHDYEKAQATIRLMNEIAKGRRSGETEGWPALRGLLSFSHLPHALFRVTIKTGKIAKKGGAAMIRIALVEDEAEVRAQLQGYVQRHTRQYGTEFAVTEFADGMELLDDYRPVYDILFLDVEIKHLDGMETARRVRELDKDVIIVFITNMAQYAIGGYAVGALDYVLKPVPYFAFSQQLRKAEEQLRRRARHYLALPVEGGMRRLDSSLIYYLESEGHRVHFYTEEGDFVAAGTLKAFEEKLAERPFARCNSGYLVNLAQVKSVQQGMVQVGPYELQVSRPRRKAFLAALADHIGGEGA